MRVNRGGDVFSKSEEIVAVWEGRFIRGEWCWVLWEVVMMLVATLCGMDVDGVGTGD